jgi:hypothetical protein
MIISNCELRIADLGRYRAESWRLEAEGMEQKERCQVSGVRGQRRLGTFTISDFELRIADLKARSQETEFRIQNEK